MEESEYYQQAVNCVSGVVLEEQRKLFDQCGGDLDRFYTAAGSSDMYFSKIIKPGSEYELGYRHCTCGLVSSGKCRDPRLCECSRQSILYILRELMPEKKIQVEIVESVLRGSECCRFRIRFL